MDDHELLRRYAEDGSEQAFRQLVERHCDIVYNVAMRRLQRPHLAQEVTHAVFVALAKKAGSIRAGTILPGWLFRATRFAAAKLQRDEERRQRREQEAAMLMHAESTDDSERVWETIAPKLDDELARLNDGERGAVLLRFFQNRTFKEVSESLGISEDAAKMRVSRALEKLRRRFVKRGIAVALPALATAFSAQAAGATASVPAGLAAAVARNGSATGASSALAQAVLRKLLWWKWKPFVVSGGTIALATSLAFFVSRQNKPAPPPPGAWPAWPAQR